MHVLKYLLSSFSLLLLPNLVITSPLKEVPRSSWPNAPLTTSGRWILDSAGNNITYAGVNWPGAADTMIPEGLQYNSIANIVSEIKSLGMNVIRLTYAIEMIDDYYAGGEEDVSILTSFQTALGSDNGTVVFNQVVANNPTFNGKTTRMEVFDAIATECAQQQIYVHLDNHMSLADWCCSEDDGNAWFGDTYFNVSNWLRGLEYMATRGLNWPSLVSMSLRNELRLPEDLAALESNYTWSDWYTNIVPATKVINTANPSVLIFLSGLGYDTDLSPIAIAAPLSPSETTFQKSDFVGYEDKLVLELHNYDTDTTSCDVLESDLYLAGYNALDSTNSSIKNVMPVVMTEWGHSQDSATYESLYQTCLQSYLTDIKAGWMIWVLAGSYYIRQGAQDSDESYGLLNHTWQGWRDSADIDSVIIPMVTGTKTYG